MTTSEVPMPPPSHDRPDRILDLLEESGGWRSGEEISGLLGVSRAAVAKHVAVLRERGHAIASLTRRGYCLLVRNDPLEAAVVESALHTKVLGRKDWHVFAETASTNNEAARLAMEGAPEGSVVFAERQTKGHGRKGKAWFSAPRGLQFSVILRPDLPARALEQLHVLGVLAVAEALEAASGLVVQRKAPNDVLINGRKTAGVLAVTGFRAEEPDWAVLGIGCNVNALAEDFPPELHGRVTSPLAEGAAALSRAALLAAVLDRLEYWYNTLQSDGAEALERAWESGLRLPTG